MSNSLPWKCSIFGRLLILLAHAQLGAKAEYSFLLIRSAESNIYMPFTYTHTRTRARTPHTLRNRLSFNHF